MNTIENLKWRYATKKFDPAKRVSKENLEQLKEAVNLTASSYGLQPYKVLIIENPEIREKLKEASWGQPQITDSSYLFLFCNFTAVGDKEVDGYLKLRADINNQNPDDSKDYGDMMKSQMSSLSPEQMAAWTSKQTYIALGTLMVAAAEIKVDVCPMEGFDKEQYDKILGLKDMGLTSSVLGAVGYRDENDPYLVFRKTRKPNSEIFKTI